MGDDCKCLVPCSNGTNFRGTPANLPITVWLIRYRHCTRLHAFGYMAVCWYVNVSAHRVDIRAWVCICTSGHKYALGYACLHIKVCKPTCIRMLGCAYTSGFVLFGKGCVCKLGHMWVIGGLKVWVCPYKFVCVYAHLHIECNCKIECM